jgi:predicted porin
LHEGVNASLGLSVFSTFGSGHTWSGAGFSENASMMYAMPLGKKFSAAIGGYIKNTSWAHDSFRSAGLSATLNYQANDRLNVYAYGQKSLLNNRHIPLPLYYMDDVADRIGIGAEYKVTPAFSIGLSVDYSRYKDPNPWFDHYNADIKQQNREFPR